MAEPTITICEDYIKEELKRIDDLPIKNRVEEEYFLRNALYYGYLLQEKDLRVSWDILAPLVGLTRENLVLICRDFRTFIKVSNEQGFVFFDNMMKALDTTLNDPALNYHINSRVPFFNGITGKQLINYLNLLDSPTGITFTSLFMDAFRDVLPGISIHAVNDQLPHICLVTGPDEIWHFLLVVFPNAGTLTSADVERLAGHLWAIEDDIPSKYSIGIPILLFAPAISYKGSQFASHRKQMHHVWAFSALRFFHLLHNTVLQCEKIKLPLQTIIKHFPVIFTAQGSPTVFSVRQAIKNLENAITKEQRGSERSEKKT